MLVSEFPNELQTVGSLNPTEHLECPSKATISTIGKCMKMLIVHIYDSLPDVITKLMRFHWSKWRLTLETHLDYATGKSALLFIKPKNLALYSSLGGSNHKNTQKHIVYIIKLSYINICSNIYIYIYI